ncbi:MAG: dephospho-CoA kinase [Nitrospirales bacterium]|nr:MAG: dephospho-CoA kinase [Nitrospirales bacterium]
MIVAGKNPMLWCDMLIVGLTGGLASGKSTIAQIFQQYGAWIIDADCLTREVVKPHRVAWKDIIRTFGRTILTEQNTVNRAALADTVFGNPRKLKQLTNILYPRVAREQARIVRQVVQKNLEAVIIYDAAMLIESDAYTRMDRVIVVTANQRIQIQRACQRTGMSRAEAVRRIRHQMPLPEKKRYADYVINGALPLPQLRPIVRNLYRLFQKEARQKTAPLRI